MRLSPLAALACLPIACGRGAPAAEIPRARTAWALDSLPAPAVARTAYTLAREADGVRVAYTCSPQVMQDATPTPVLTRAAAGSPRVRSRWGARDTVETWFSADDGRALSPVGGDAYAFAARLSVADTLRLDLDGTTVALPGAGFAPAFRAWLARCDTGLVAQLVLPHYGDAVRAAR